MGTMERREIDLDRLKAEIAQEKQMKEMLDQSLKELQMTVEELEKRGDGLGDENNEWKTRYETQCEMNQQLEKQAVLLQDKIIDARTRLKENQMPRALRGVQEDDANPQYVKSMEKEKLILEGQYRDLEWRLDQESKAYHKANEERKAYNTELQQAKGTVEYLKRKGVYTEYQDNRATSETPRGENIPEDQRVLDPKMGPIKKTAAVKTLPHLD